MIGLKVPFRISSGGYPAVASGEYETMAARLHALLLTRLGERVMRPRFGSRVGDLVFEPILDDVFEAEAEGEILDAISVWEPNCDVVDIAISFDGGSRVDFDVQFRLRSTLSDQTSSVSVSIDVGGTVRETPE